ncbi:MAG TPA: VanZ family protein [Bryobacteraceae bacterium]|nr:VanZ family protein [Bryobacteraceae bacterium]
MNRRGWLWLIASSLWAGVIFYSSTSSAERLCDRALNGLIALLSPSSQFNDGVPPDYFWEKKAIHVALFFTLAFLLSRTSAYTTRLAPGHIVLLGAAIGTASELLQLLFPSREPAVRDTLINTAAVCAGVLAFHPWGRRQAKPNGSLTYERH